MTEPQRKTRVALLFGGRSSEHLISCATAGSVLEHIDRDRYEVVPIGIARDGRFVLQADDPAPLALERSPEVGEGDVDWAALGEQLRRLAPDAPFIPEIWMGHVNDGEGFFTALDRLEKWL